MVSKSDTALGEKRLKENEKQYKSTFGYPSLCTWTPEGAKKLKDFAEIAGEVDPADQHTRIIPIKSFANTMFRAFSDPVDSYRLLGPVCRDLVYPGNTVKFDMLALEALISKPKIREGKS